MYLAAIHSLLNLGKIIMVRTKVTGLERGIKAIFRLPLNSVSYNLLLMIGDNLDFTMMLAMSVAYAIARLFVS